VEKSTIRESLEEFRAIPTRKIDAGGRPWEYLSLGDSDSVILFLHGMGGAYDIWWMQMMALRDEFKVVSLTYPPVGSLEGLSQGVLAVLEEEGIKRANIVGSSLGGYLAQYLVARHPEIVERAVFGNTFPPNDIYRRENERVMSIARFLPEFAVSRVLRRRMVRDVLPASADCEAVRMYVLEMCGGRMTKADLLARYRCVIERFEPCGKNCGRELMLIESDNDPMVPPGLREELRGLYDFSAVHTFHGTGHFPYLCAPDEYTELLRSFFGR